MGTQLCALEKSKTIKIKTIYMVEYIYKAESLNAVYSQYLMHPDNCNEISGMIDYIHTLVSNKQLIYNY